MTGVCFRTSKDQNFVEAPFSSRNQCAEWSVSNMKRFSLKVDVTQISDYDPRTALNLAVCFITPRQVATRIFIPVPSRLEFLYPCLELYNSSSGRDENFGHPPEWVLHAPDDVFLLKKFQLKSIYIDGNPRLYDGNYGSGWCDGFRAGMGIGHSCTTAAL